MRLSLRTAVTTIRRNPPQTTPATIAKVRIADEFISPFRTGGGICGKVAGRRVRGKPCTRAKMVDRHDGGA